MGGGGVLRELKESNQSKAIEKIVLKPKKETN
jgi:hypothetical protein